MLTCFDVAGYFLSQCDEDSGDTISNLKLQKLVYYAQGFSLVLLDKPLFPEKIEAWMHGPVVPDLYRRYREHGNNALPAPEQLDLSKYSEDEIELLDEVYRVYGQFSAWKLRNMTHEETPWKTTYLEGEPSQEIATDSMAEFFKTLVN
ncbi:type II toxin-antitoxin system antitoxin SocA domain-containing protein [Klebsiella michiganensis]|uniref:Panacea domain-containing protein n=1 Tax=Klebsiella michiganensis TaxID=1134687 RepID=UPI0032D9EFA7